MSWVLKAEDFKGRNIPRTTPGEEHFVWQEDSLSRHTRAKMNTENIKQDGRYQKEIEKIENICCFVGETLKLR